MTAGSCSPVRTRPPGRTAAVGRSVPRSCGTAGVSTRCARPPRCYGPSGDTPPAPRLGWQLWALRPGLDGASRPSTTLTGRGGTAGFGATPDRNRRLGVAAGVGAADRSRRKPPPAPAPTGVLPGPLLPGTCRRSAGRSAAHRFHTNHRRRSTYAVFSGVSFECRLTGARTDPPETSSPEVCSFQLPQVCSFRLLLTSCGHCWHAGALPAAALACRARRRAGFGPAR